MEKQNAKKPSFKEIFSWCMFDFANSSYITVVITTVYSTFFVSYIVAGQKGDFFWGIATASANFMAVILGPILGTISDYKAQKKKFLIITSALCIFTTALLFFPSSGHVGFAIFLLAFSYMAFNLTENFISSFLPEISTKKNIGKISGYAWALGYIGGVISLVIAILIIKKFGSITGVKVSMLMIAAFFLLSALPAFINLKERSEKKPLASDKNVIKASFSDLIYTFKNVKQNKNLLVFLLSFFFFSCGIAIVFTFSAIYAKQELGFKMPELMLLIISVNLLASVGALLFGFIQDKIGAKPTVLITLIIWCAVILGIVLTTSKTAFFAIGVFVGLSLGSTQSASRAMIGLLTKEGRFGEDYGLWGFSGKLAAIVGSFSFGLLVLLTHSRRIAVFATLGFFLAGLIILLFVKVGDKRKVVPKT